MIVQKLSEYLQFSKSQLSLEITATRSLKLNHDKAGTRHVAWIQRNRLCFFC